MKTFPRFKIEKLYDLTNRKSVWIVGKREVRGNSYVYRNCLGKKFDTLEAAQAALEATKAGVAA